MKRRKIRLSKTYVAIVRNSCITLANPTRHRLNFHNWATLVLHKSQVRKSNVRLGLIDFFFFLVSSISFDCRIQSNSIRELSVRLGSIEI